ncbi:MAG: helicase-related protein [Candidatus Binataceae bacterium]
MSRLADHEWLLKYTRDEGDLVALFYQIALTCAVRYDRLTGYFNAGALTLAARGIEGLVRNGGRMRLVVGCTLGAEEVAAIEKGESLKDTIERHMLANPLAPSNQESIDALELLAWMVANGHLEVKVSIPCDEKRRPTPADGIFHEKSGIIEDERGDTVAFTGSNNETPAGWQGNWESFLVFTSWREPERVGDEESNFGKIWSGNARRVLTFDVPTAVRDNLLQFLPNEDRPARLKRTEVAPEPKKDGTPKEVPEEPPLTHTDLRRLVWEFIGEAPRMPDGGERVGEATAAVAPWPHQVRAFQMMYGNWPPKLLIADEVGLGKTIEAGLLIRQAWLAGKARRIIVLAPKGLLKQWQIELREKFNLNWPIYDGQKLIWYPSPSMRGHNERAVGRSEWHKEPAVIVSSQLLRRQDRADDLLATADPWDLTILDEAHHARRRAPGAPTEGGPNRMLRLMQRLRERTQGLVLLTATPMQVHPVEIWDLLNLLGLPHAWDAAGFVRFFREIEEPSPSVETFEHLARMFRAAEEAYGEVKVEEVARLGGVSRLKARKVLDALRDEASIPRRRLETPERKLAIRVMKRSTPVARLVLRATRETLRAYFRQGRLSTPIADREIDDQFIDLSPDEQMLYQAVDDYISTAYGRASEKERNAVGFLLTIYRRRLASSFAALRNTLEDHLAVISGAKDSPAAARAEEDALEDASADEEPDSEEVVARESEGLAAQERAEIETLLANIRKLPPDSKVEKLKKVLADLRSDGYPQVMVFTQYTDTMDFIREELASDNNLRALCFSGRGGEVRDPDGTWRTVSRDDIKRRFKEGKADVLLCTDAAAEGLNFQFCGALVNYDLPWNPMKVEQRIGRIDRLGQKFAKIRAVNLHYRDTIESDIYISLGKRHNMFQQVVGRLQPILSRLPNLVAETVLSGQARDPESRRILTSRLESEAKEAEASGFDLEAAIDEDFTEPNRPAPRLSLDDIDLVIRTNGVLPPGVEVQTMGTREYSYLAPGMPERLRVTTDAAYYEEHSDSVELWSPGITLFPTVEIATETNSSLTDLSIREILGDSRSMASNE